MKTLAFLLTALHTASVIACGECTPVFPGVGAVDEDSGAFVYEVSDELIGRGSSEARTWFLRRYDSAIKDSGSLGPGWCSLFDITLQREPDGVMALEECGGVWRRAFAPRKIRHRHKGMIDAWVAPARKQHLVQENGKYILYSGYQAIGEFDARGLPLRLALPAIGETLFKRDSANVLAAIVEDGRTLILTYAEDNGRLTRITDGKKRLRFSYTPTGRLEGVLVDDAVLEHYVYDSSGWLTRIERTLANVTKDLHSIEYFESGRVARWRNEDGNERAYGKHQMDAPISNAGQTSASTSTDTNAATAHHSPRKETEHDTMGRIARKLFSFNSGASIEHLYFYPDDVSLLPGLAVAIFRQPDGTLEKEKLQWKGIILDDSGRVAHVMRSDGKVLKFSYDASGRIVTLANEHSQVVKIGYDKGALPARIELPQLRRSLQVRYASHSTMPRIQFANSRKAPPPAELRWLGRFLRVASDVLMGGIADPKDMRMADPYVMPLAKKGWLDRTDVAGEYKYSIELQMMNLKNISWELEPFF